MRVCLSQRQRLFLRTELWRNGRPTRVVGWLAAGVFFAAAGLVAGAATDPLVGVVLGGMGIVLFVSNWVFALVFGELRLQRAVYERVYSFLNAVTQATYPYDRTTFPMQVYVLTEADDGSLRVCLEDAWWGGPHTAHTHGTIVEHPHPAPTWVSQAVDVLTRVEGVRVLPTLQRFTTFADREHPTPTMHQVLALRAAVLAHTPPGVTPVWT